MAMFPAFIQQGSGAAIESATLSVASPVSISAGHVAVATAWRSAQNGTPVATISISGTQDVDYEILLNDTTTNFQTGWAPDLAQQALVVRAINNISITLSNSGGINFGMGGTIVYDLSP